LLVIVGVGAAAVSVGLLVQPADLERVDTASEATTTTVEMTTSTAPGAPSTTTPTTIPPATVPPTTVPVTTVPPPTTVTAPPATAAPPVTAPPTTIPAAPIEFAATVRGVDEGPDFYGVFYGTTFGGGGGFNVFAACRPGSVTVTVLDDGMVSPLPAGQRPVTLVVSVDDTTSLAEFVSAQDGQVFTGAVTSRVRVQVLYPSNHDVRIQYDCRG
jgi:hypothetical protein